MAMPSTTRQFSNSIASKPEPKGDASKALNTNELDKNISKLLDEFEQLHRVQRLPLTHKKLIAIRNDLEKAMPHLYQLTDRKGRPYPSKRIIHLKNLAEERLREFNVDLNTLRPQKSKAINVMKTVPATANNNFNDLSSFQHAQSTTMRALNFNIEQQLSKDLAQTHLVNTTADATTTATPATTTAPIPPHIQTPFNNLIRELLPSQLAIRGDPSIIPSHDVSPSSDKFRLTTSTLSLNQKTLLCAVHDVVDKLNQNSWGEDLNNENSNNSSSNNEPWVEAPAALSPDELQSIDHSNCINDNSNNNNGGNRGITSGTMVGINVNNGAGDGAGAGAGGGGAGIMGDMSFVDGRAQMNGMFGSFVQPAYMQSVPNGNNIMGVGGVATGFHQQLNRE